MSVPCRVIRHPVWPEPQRIGLFGQDTLQKHHDDADCADLTEGELFVLALTLHLQEVNHDEHLWVRWLPSFVNVLSLWAMAHPCQEVKP